MLSRGSVAPQKYFQASEVRPTGLQDVRTRLRIGGLWSIHPARCRKMTSKNVASRRIGTVSVRIVSLRNYLVAHWSSFFVTTLRCLRLRSSVIHARCWLDWKLSRTLGCTFLSKVESGAPKSHGGLVGYFALVHFKATMPFT